ncbi:DUF5701 family protein [Streptacidiphilus sp. ASG 303]|uniref:DUF5701 family protein n=1 Tax=Streptacidiphilus sp. ASG 303 TaxID=2896847 RepID=UPI001E629D4A|nr:DUF5701 family protein [Streptacidiphilus sp. ASG 303]MCD0483394.1 DUF5701 family protein [Streptacidiphilus sp. ASG 303]
MSFDGCDAGAEFDRQLGVLVDRGYPEAAGVDASAFAAMLAPLREVAVARGAGTAPPSGGRVPFLLVVTRDLVPVEESVPRTTLAGKDRPGVVDRNYRDGDLARFAPAGGVVLPAGGAYLLLDVDRGEEFCGAVPDEAVEAVAARGRSPLTIEEGIALVTLHPGALEKNRCFSLGGSRCGDRRVPAVWISRGAPKLGWCWAGNPHTWLGMASAAARVGTGADRSAAVG